MLQVDIARKIENITLRKRNDLKDGLFPEDRKCSFIVCMFVVHNLSTRRGGIA